MEGPERKTEEFEILPGTEEASESSGPEDLQLKEKVIEVLKTIFDPEIPVDIWELGLIYKLVVKESGSVTIEMTLTSPACPVAESLPPEVERRVKEIEGVKEVDLNVVWDPPWSMEKMSEAARLQLGFL